jgi:phosphoadenosine phosphosulfate reductase
MSGNEWLETLRRRHGQRDGGDLLAAMAAEFPGRLGIISSFGIESAVLLDLAAGVDPSLPVIFLDSGELFDETHDYRRLLVERLGLTDVRRITPAAADLAAAEELWRSDPDGCCHLRKVRPLHGVVAGFDALVDGRKRIHGAGRSALQTIEPGDKGVLKISPLARWSEQRIAEHFRDRGLPVHPLVRQGYRSVGCWPCSRPSLAGEGPRAGRWAGQGKSECGIHLPQPAEAAE